MFCAIWEFLGSTIFQGLFDFAGLRGLSFVQDLIEGSWSTVADLLNCV